MVKLTIDRAENSLDMLSLRRTLAAATAAAGMFLTPPFAAAATPASTTQPGTVSLIDQAIASLGEERDLIQRARPGLDPTPSNATVGTLSTEAQRELIAVDERGAVLLGALEEKGLALSTAIRDTLGRLPDIERDPTARPPVPARYEAAIADLTALRAQLTSPAVAAGDAPVVAAAPGAGGGDGESGLSTVLLLGLGGMLVGGLGAGAWVLRRGRHSHHLAALALHDELTGVANRRCLEQDLTAEQARGQRPVSVLMVDIDHFKQFNDHHGHRTGDAVLRQVAAAMASVVRAQDVVYRYGGEEFCVLLPDATVDEAAGVADRIRAAATNVVVPGTGRITVSVGLAQGPSVDVVTTLDRADGALLLAKRSGRDRVTVAA